MTTAALIFARSTSKRFPGKVTMHLNGRPVLSHVIERAQQLPGVDYAVLAIPYGNQQQELIDIGLKHNITIIQGPEYDVLTRMVMAAGIADCDNFYRVTADNPLLEVQAAHMIYTGFIDGLYDYGYMVNAVDGCAIELMTTDAILKVQDEYAGNDPYLREHPTLSFYRNRDIFNLMLFAAPAKWQRQYRLTVDAPEDLTVLRAIFRNCGDGVSLDQAIQFLDENPQLASINSHISQKNRIG
jgi:spore coat polysaccharide biosynthesis protein SpsF (cytidylyltransferase family)